MKPSHKLRSSAQSPPVLRLVLVSCGSLWSCRRFERDVHLQMHSASSTLELLRVVPVLQGRREMKHSWLFGPRVQLAVEVDFFNGVTLSLPRTDFSGEH